MQLPVYFIADAHLLPTSSPEESIKVRRLLDFLETIRHKKATLFIVGDLFDFWFEYRSAVFACYFRVLRALQELVDSGCEVHFIGGNHDYWAGSFLSQEIGLHVHYHPLNLTIHGHLFHITHGDGILRNDFGYRVLRAVLRNNLIIRSFRLLHPDWAMYIARKVSGKSRRLNRRLPAVQARDREDLLLYGNSQIQQGAEYVIVGHLHLPIQTRQNSGVIVNLGDWMYYYTFAYYDGQELRLAYWQDAKPQIGSPDQANRCAGGIFS